ncbi:MAG TPA: GNAT family N-acetyltransferase, partial [Mariprofundaceae bacterium]|nr:GNAT family N-acetyltransferase [Mariprofundaceae bacterium]
PTHLVSHWQLPDGTDITIRPIRPEDAKSEQDFVHNLSEEAKYFRFMHSVQDLSDDLLVRFTQIDYDREMALLAVTEQDSRELEIGVCRYTINPDGESCEFALVVSDAWQHKAVGHKLMGSLMDAARAKGLKTMEGEVLASNHGMLRLVETLGFTVTDSEEDDSVKKIVRVL